MAMKDFFEKDYRADASLMVVERHRVWRKLGKPAEREFDWITRQSLRTLVKRGNWQALTLLGDRAHPKIEVGEIKLDQENLRPRDTLLFSIALTALRDESCLVDGVIDFVKAKGKTAPKVHKPKPLDLSKGESVHVEK